MNDRFRFRAWDKDIKRYWEDGNFDLRRAREDESLIIEQCTGIKDKNGRLIYEGDIVTYYHNKKKLMPVTDRKPFEALYGNDEETGLPLQYRTVKVIRYKGYVSIGAIGVELNLPHDFHWWRTLEKDILTQVEIIGNLHENPELLEDK